MSKDHAEVEEQNEMHAKYECVEDIPGVGPATASKLVQAGFQTVESLATASVKELAVIGIGEKVAMEIVAHAREGIAIRFVTVADLLKLRHSVRQLTTGSKAVDDLLAGGIETQIITEFYGEYGVGKSIMCHQLAVDVQLPEEKGGLGGAALYIDTENTFRPEWIARMAKARGLNPDEVAKNIIYAEAYNSDHQILLLEKADTIIKENNVRLIIVDSLTAHFRSEYLGREMLPMRQQKLNSHVHRLGRLARVFNAVAIVTNQVMAKPDAQFATGFEPQPVGGHVLAHASHNRILLRRKHGSPIRIARLVSSTHIPEGERIFKVTENGIEDAEQGELPARRS